MYVIEDLRIEPRQKLSQMYCKNNGCHFFQDKIVHYIKVCLVIWLKYSPSP